MFILIWFSKMRCLSLMMDKEFIDCLQKKMNLCSRWFGDTCPVVALVTKNQLKLSNAWRTHLIGVLTRKRNGFMHLTVSVQWPWIWRNRNICVRAAWVRNVIADAEHFLPQLLHQMPWQIPARCLCMFQASAGRTCIVLNQAGHMWVSAVQKKVWLWALCLLSTHAAVDTTLIQTFVWFISSHVLNIFILTRMRRNFWDAMKSSVRLKSERNEEKLLRWHE